MRLTSAIILIVIAVGLIGLSLSAYTVDENKQAIVLQLGNPVGDVKGPGLHFKIPIVQDVRYFEQRILSVDAEPEQVVISSSDVTSLIEKDDKTETELEEGETAKIVEDVSAEPIIVDTFARYKISDPLAFLRSLRTERAASSRIENIMNDATRTVLGKATLRELLSEERTKIMQDIRNRVNAQIVDDDLGIDIIDVRIVRADLTPQLRQSTVRRMISELKERATEIRAEGEKTALKIRSTAEKEKAILLAEADRESKLLRGEGDRQAIRIYADAYNRDQDFYAFSRSMEAYKKTLSDKETRLILSPTSEFLKYFKSVEGNQ